MLSESGWTALVALRDLSGGKTRLAATLGPSERRALTEFAATAVVRSCVGAQAVAETFVVTGSEAVARWAVGVGAGVWREPAGVAGLAPVMQAAAAHFASPARNLVLLMGDLPLLQPADLDRWLRRASETEVALAPSRSGEGTNLLALRAGCTMSLSFGRPHSLALHRSAARAARLRYRTLPCSAAALDVDEPADLALLATQPAACQALHFLNR